METRIKIPALTTSSPDVADIEFIKEAPMTVTVKMGDVEIEITSKDFKRVMNLFSEWEHYRELKDILWPLY